MTAEVRKVLLRNSLRIARPDVQIANHLPSACPAMAWRRHDLPMSAIDEAPVDAMMSATRLWISSSVKAAGSPGSRWLVLLLQEPNHLDPAHDRARQSLSALKSLLRMEGRSSTTVNFHPLVASNKILLLMSRKHKSIPILDRMASLMPSDMVSAKLLINLRCHARMDCRCGARFGDCLLRRPLH